MDKKTKNTSHCHLVNLGSIWWTVNFVNSCDLIEGKDQVNEPVDVGTEAGVVGAQVQLAVPVLLRVRCPQVTFNLKI